MGLRWNAKRFLWMRNGIRLKKDAPWIFREEIESVRLFGWMGPRWFVGLIVHRDLPKDPIND